MSTMPNNPFPISALIRQRRSVFPKFYKPDAPIDRATIEQLLENANWAPTHKLTEPWRFQVFHSAESRTRLGDYLAGYYRTHTPPEVFSAEKFEKMRDNPRRAGAVIAIVLHRDPAESLPEFEEIAAVAMAVQNMWLSCTELGLGCYWSTPKAALEAGDFLRLAPNERCLGLFYLGWHEMPEIDGKRTAIEEKVVWA
ncbi:MAG: nitroreductase [Saprospiraceae bacterium]|nr:nitroreductase [Saprospiraceae bacterium]